MPIGVLQGATGCHAFFDYAREFLLIWIFPVIGIRKVMLTIQ